MDEEESSESEDQQLDLQPLSLGKENKIKLNV